MGAIVVEPLQSEGECNCCGRTATARVRFQGPGANRRAKLILCDGCGRLLGQVLAEEKAENPALKMMN